MRIGDSTPRGYAAEDFHDAWDRYLPPYMDVCNKPNKRNIFDNENNFVADVVDVAEGMAGGGVSADDLKHACLCKACDALRCPTCQPERFGLHPKSKIGDGDFFAILKDELLIPDLPAFLYRRLRA